MYYTYKLYKKKIQKFLVFSSFLSIGPERNKEEKRIRDKEMYELFCKEEENKKGHGLHNEQFMTK